MAKKQNELYDHHTPIRLTELQDSEIRKYAEANGLTVNDTVRCALVAAGIISAGPEAKARKGYEKA